MRFVVVVLCYFVYRLEAGSVHYEYSHWKFYFLLKYSRYQLSYPSHLYYLMCE